MTGAWTPANDLERELLAAINGPDRRRFFRLIAAADLVLPAFVEADPQVRQRFLTVTLFGQEYLPVFTSPAAAVRALGGAVGAYTMTTCAELQSKWPSPAWRLAINPGSPIDAYLPIGAVAEAASGVLAIPTAAELLAEGRAEAIVAAAAASDGDGYLRALLDCEVFVPAAREVGAEALTGGTFPWCLTRVPVELPPLGAPEVRTIIEVTTLPERPADAAHGIVVPFTALAVAWPDPAYELAVTTGGRVVSVPGSYMSALAVTAGLD